MASLVQDLRYAGRMLRKTPGFTFVAAITLALGIGANTAIFSVVNAVLLRPLPYPQSERIVWVFRTQPPIMRGPISRPDYLEWQSQNQSFRNLAAINSETFNLTGVDEAERLRGARVTEDFFDIFGLAATQGRLLLPSDNQPGSPRVAVISYGLWQRRFGGDAGAVGKSMSLNGDSYTVVGVSSKQFDFGGMEVWTPARLGEDQHQRGNNYLRILARLKDGVTVEQAQAQMNQVAASQAAQYPNSDANLTVTVSPLLQDYVREIRSVLWMMLAAVAAVLLIACSNVANLLLARAMARQKEIAIRTAMGANRRDIIRQLLTESVLLALIGGALGVLLAVWAVNLLVAFAPSNIPRLKEIGVDKWALGFTLTISLLTGIFFGLVPALQVSKSDLNETLKEGGRGPSAASPHRARMRRVLTVGEIAVSMVLLISAGLLIGSIQRLTKVDPGFNPRPLLTVDVSFPRQPAPAASKAAGEKAPDKPEDGYLKEVQRCAAFLGQLKQRLTAVAGVQTVGAINDLPVTGRSSVNGDFSVLGQPAPEPGHAPVAEFRAVTPDYFSAIGIPVIKGRVFADTDTTTVSPVIVINETLARRFFGDDDPIGKQLNALTGRPSQIVGVVGDARQWGLDQPADPEIYFAYAQQNFSPTASLVVRGSGDPAQLSSAVRSIVREVNAEAPILRLRTMSTVLADSTAQQRFNMTLMAVFAGVALVMATIGLYGVMSHSVTQRGHEIGIRLALGARRGNILRMVVGQGMTLAGIGVGLGLGLALAATRFLANMLFGVSATDPSTFVVVSISLLAVALAACIAPAYRATRVDPMIALRYE